MKKSNVQTSESLICIILLAISGGGLDAYTYLCHGGKFANGQTGNLALLGLHLSEGDFQRAIGYLFPITFYIIGIILADYGKMKLKIKQLHWRQIIILIEIIILIGLVFIPYSHNQIANALVSLVCGIQVESFRTVSGHAITTTMCTGNLRLGTYNTNRFFATKKIEHLKLALTYYSVIIFFVAGAISEGILIKLKLGNPIILPIIFLIIPLLIMFKREIKIGKIA